MNQREGRKEGRSRENTRTAFCFVFCFVVERGFVCFYRGEKRRGEERREEEDFTVKERGYLEERKRKRVFFQ